MEFTVELNELRSPVRLGFGQRLELFRNFVQLDVQGLNLIAVLLFQTF